MVKVEISAKIYREIEKRVKESGFETAEEYIIFVLEELLKDEPSVHLEQLLPGTLLGPCQVSDNYIYHKMI